MHSRLEQYVEEVSRGLEDLTEARRTNELTEVRQHLEASVKAYKELGLEETAAMEEAVRQFGAARKVSGGLRKAYWREKLFVADSLWGTALLAVCIQFIVGGILGPINQLLSGGVMAAFKNQFGVAPIAANVAAMLIPTLISGYIVGRVNPRFAVRGTLLGKSIYSLYSVLGMQLFILVNEATSPGVIQWSPNSWVIRFGLPVMGVALSALAAYVGSRHAARQRAKV